jgi:hypothetical protein
MVTVRRLKIVLMSGTLVWPSVSLPSPLLPSQEQSNFFNVRICRDREVLSALKAAAARTLETKVIVAHGRGQEWSGYEPNDIHLEAVSVSPDDERNSVFCSVTISAKRITERIVYTIVATSSAWLIRFGGKGTSRTGGHKLFPEGPITVEPKGKPGTQ